jgi:DNA-binding CsgD family transcriptional regulator
MEVSNDYALFFKFIEKYAGQCFENIDPIDPLMVRMEQMMERNNQFFYVIDFTLLRVIYSSMRSLQMMGLKPEEVNPRNLFIKTHPDELKRHGISAAKGIKKANEVFADMDKDYLIMSTNHRFLNNQGKYQNQMIQVYGFKIMNPDKNVYGINVHTDISWFNKKIYGFNNYFGKDLSHFRFPDEELIMEGCVFSKREFEILKLIKEGYRTDEMAERLFVSPHTVETHRRNILKKSNITNTKDLIIDLMEKGVL